MSVRAVIIGLLLGLAISAATYFNDFVIIQTMLIGNFLPLSVFGVLVILVFLANPALRLLGTQAPLRAPEVAIIGAIALAACGFPASGFYRGFSTVAGLTAHWYKTETAWQAVGAMSYFPSGSPTLAPGFVQDPEALAGTLADALAVADEGGPETPQTVVASMLSQQSRYVVMSLAAADRLPLDAAELLARALNEDVILPVGRDGHPPLWRALVARDDLPASAAAFVEQKGAMDELADAAREEQAKARTALEQWMAESGGRLTELERQRAELGSRIMAARDGGGPAPTDLEQERESVDAQLTPLQARRRALQQAVDLAGNRATYYAGEAAVMEQRANRAALTAVAGEALLPEPPQAPGLMHTRTDSFVTDTLLEGRAAGQRLGVTELPWYAWGPTAMRWWPLMMAMAMMGLGVALVVHPQWSRRELLSYPIPRFVDELSEREPGAWLPKVASNRLFWVAFLALVGLHTVNGIDAWLKLGVHITTKFNFTPLRELFPLLGQIQYSSAYFEPTVYLSVVAFAFFLTTQASFSVGISHLLYMLLGAFMLAQGAMLQNDYMGAKNGNMVRFGAFVGVFLMILYTGRRYYLNVLASSVGLPRRADTPVSATWAMRLAILSFAAMVYIMTTFGMTWFYAAALSLLVLLMITVISRVVCETGMFFIQPQWVPVGILTGMLGFEAIGPTQYLLLAIVSVMILIDPREVFAPFLTNALKMGENTGKTSTGKLAGWLAVMMVSGLLVAGVATLYFQYQEGVNRADGWTRKNLPSHAFTSFSRLAADARGQGTLVTATATEGLEKLSLIRIDESLYIWAAIGVGLVIATAIARLRLPWWPLHPVAFVVWGTYPISQFAFSFLLGWMVKASVTRTAGAKGYQATKPLMIGVIAGELFMGLVWIVIGWIYYLSTGQQPTNYRIFPG